MDLTARLLRFTAVRPHVFVVPAVGGTAARLAVEAELVRRGWPRAGSPADTDLLIVAGTPGPRLAEVVDAVWRQVPAPRARADVRTSPTAAAELDRAAAALADASQQRPPALHPTPSASAAPSPAAHHLAAAADGHHRGGAERRDHAHRTATGHDPAHNLMPMSDPPVDADDPNGALAEHGESVDPGDGGEPGHEGGHHAGHHGAGMDMPGGLPMADLGADRDGLTLDQLHVGLGPALPDWPAGLVVHVVLQGDVVQQARVEVLDPGTGASFWDGVHPAARELDSLGRLFAVTGWDDVAARTRRLRDELLAGTPAEQLMARTAQLGRQVRRSRTLRWLTRAVPGGALDVLARLQQRMQAVTASLAAPPPGAAAAPAEAHPPAPGVAGSGWASLLVGAELAAVRLIVAALDPDTDTAATQDDGDGDGGGGGGGGGTATATEANTGHHPGHGEHSGTPHG
ncbi:hypothetical protein [Pseudonocardia sp. GCM10023141]|uniref:hypothetical protein n=1 Tax=Pseudonocardia sp. GCM10023141 TaxID=3252653 RepID=UPI003614DE5D